MNSLGFGVWALVGFQFWVMETVMCYPFCIREFKGYIIREGFNNGPVYR